MSQTLKGAVKTKQSKRRQATEPHAKSEAEISDIHSIEQEHAKQQSVPWGYIALLIFGLVLLAGCSLIAMTHSMPWWEAKVFVHINSMQLPHWAADQVAKPLSDAVWGILALLAIFLLIPKFRLRAWQLLVAAGSTYVATFLVEHFIDRARPEGLTHDLVLRASQGGPGFPSGHVAVLTALCLTVWGFVSWPWRIVLVVLVGAEAWARVYLGVHAPLDVVGGVAVACIVVAVIHLLPSKIRDFFHL